MENKIKEIMSNVFNVPVEEITTDSSPDTIETWDSLSHMNLILALEQNLGVSFTPEETIEMMSYELILYTLNEKGLP